MFYPTATTEKAREKEVQAFAIEFENRVKKGELFAGEKMTFAELVPLWYEQFAEKKVTLRVREDYISQLEKYYLPELGNMKMSDIRPYHIQKVLANMERKGLSFKTIRNCFTPINSVFTFAFKQGFIKENICFRCTLPKSNPDGIVDDDTEEELHFFDIEETVDFLTFLDSGYDITYPERIRTKRNGEKYTVAAYTIHRDVPPLFVAYFYLAIFSGCRLSELCALKWKNINWEDNTIDIKTAISKTKAKGQIVKGPKTKKGYRTISLPSVCFEKLQILKKAEEGRMNELGSLWIGESQNNFNKNYVFIKWSNGGRIDIDTPGDKFNDLIEHYNSTHEKKLPKIRLHDLRHTSATLLLAAGVDIETVSKRLGHKKASTTLDIYGHSIPAKNDEAACILNQLLNPSYAKKS